VGEAEANAGYSDAECIDLVIHVVTHGCCIFSFHA